MLAVLYTGYGSVQFTHMSRPKMADIIAPKKFDDGKILLRKEDLVLIRVEAAGICGTDLHILEGTHASAPPVILGHEYVGYVVRCGSSVENFKIGDFVAVDPNIKCGICNLCRKGYLNMCRNMTTLGIFINGGFAEYSVVPAKQLHLLPRDLSPRRAVLFEPLSCVLHGLEKVKPQAGENVLIYGGGAIGCLFTAMCVRGGANVAVVESNKLRHSFIKAMGGVALLPEDQGSGEQFDLIIDAAGAPSVVPQMIRKAREGARLLLFGQQNMDARAEINPTLANQKELKIFGSYATATSFESTISALADARLPLERIVSNVGSLADVKTALNTIRYGLTLKVVLDPQWQSGDRW